MCTTCKTGETFLIQSTNGQILLDLYSKILQNRLQKKIGYTHGLKNEPSCTAESTESQDKSSIFQKQIGWTATAYRNTTESMHTDALPTALDAIVASTAAFAFGCPKLFCIV